MVRRTVCKKPEVKFMHDANQIDRKVIKLTVSTACDST
jgi:hypothetical protein